MSPDPIIPETTADSAIDPEAAASPDNAALEAGISRQREALAS